jgi:putative flippase GtrA
MPPDTIALPDLWQRISKVISAKLIGYAGISVLALGCDVAIYSANVTQDRNHTLAAILGYTAGLLVHFLLSRKLVFKSKAKGKHELLEALGFALSGIAGLAITAGVVFVSTELLHLGPAISKIIAVGTTFGGVYLLRSNFVFAERVK